MIRGSKRPHRFGSGQDARGVLPDPRWSGELPEVLRRAARLVVGRTAPLTRQTVTRVRAEIDYFSDPLLAPSDLTEWVHQGIEVAIMAMAAPHRSVEAASYSLRVGRERAVHGVPLLPMVQLYRIVGTVLWEAMVEAVLRDAPDQVVPVALAAPDYWKAVDRDIAILREGHLGARAGRGQGGNHRFVPVLRALLRGHRDPLDVSAAAIALGLPPRGRYAVARLEGTQGAAAADATLVEDGGAVGVYWCPWGRNGLAAVMVLGEAPLSYAMEALRLGSGVRGGLSPVVDGLSELGRACTLAELALGISTDGRLATLHDGVFAGFVLSRPGPASELAAAVLGPVLQAADCQLLLDTFAVWLECGGSAREVGLRLYCHRNTVLNRLHRLQQLSGRRLDRPRDLVDLALALDVHRCAGSGQQRSQG